MFIAPSLGQSVNFSCATGPSGDCSDLITGFCQSIQSTTVGQLNTVSQCFNRVNGTKCDLTAWNQNIATIPPEVACETALRTVSAVCASGGSASVAGATFKFVVNPFAGSCGIPGGT
ncbi:hypothetical protein B0H19DRAFT_1262541 [Mycena capillaripes]|nr:hypothetical protein B0H19DRAFT_1262541 [Mycena capillaripes]